MKKTKVRLVAFGLLKGNYEVVGKLPIQIEFPGMTHTLIFRLDMNKGQTGKEAVYDLDEIQHHY